MNSVGLNPTTAKASLRFARFKWLGMIVAGLLLWIVLFEYEPTAHSLYPKCILYSTTGLYCPACGATRATFQLLHGHVHAAIRYNALFVVSLPFLIRAGSRALLRSAGVLPGAYRPLPAWMYWSIFVIVFAFGIVRNLPWKPFCWLAPHDSAPTVSVNTRIVWANDAALCQNLLDFPATKTTIPALHGRLTLPAHSEGTGNPTCGV